MLIFEGKEIETDTEGYLKESSQWSGAAGCGDCRERRDFGRRQNTGKWVRFVRDFYLEFNSGDCMLGKSDGE